MENLTYKELKAKAEALLAQAEAMRVEARDGVIAEIKQKMADYGLTTDDLVVKRVRVRVRNRKKSAAAA